MKTCPRPWMVITLVLLVGVVVTALVAGGVFNDSTSAANACQERYLHKLAGVLAIRAQLGDDDSAANLTLQKALTITPDGPAATAARKTYTAELSRTQARRLRNPVPSVPVC